MICVQFFANFARWKLSTEIARRCEQMLPLIAGSEESQG